jgi:hypothetical protein
MRMFRAWVILFLAAATILPCTAASWKIQYFYDRADSRFGINDFQFLNASTGFACGFREFRKNKNTLPYMITTVDGGKTWTELSPPAIAENMFFLDGKTGWIATERGVWRTTDAGRTWEPGSTLTGINRMWFLTEKRGFAIGTPKLMKETKDGGATWTDVKAAQDVTSKPENTSFTEILFQGQRGIVAGVSIPSRPGPENPSWVDPAEAAKRRQWPTLTISLETMDGGDTWKSQTTPLFGTVIRTRALKEVGMTVIRYSESFGVPTEVYGARTGGKSQSIYKREGRIVTDVGWIGADSIIVAVEAPGKLNQLPFPGKLHVLKSLNLTDWTEVEVSYKAFGGNAILAVADEQHAWIATDSGMVLNYIP